MFLVGKVAKTIDGKVEDICLRLPVCESDFDQKQFANTYHSESELTLLCCGVPQMTL